VAGVGGDTQRNRRAWGVTKFSEAAGAILVVLSLVHAALRVPGKRAPWDRAAGTMVRYRTSRAAGP
jgi:hypothetical protein